MKFLSRRSVVIFYFSLLLIGVFLIVTGYAFTCKALDVAVFAVILIYPVIRFFSLRMPSWIKLTSGLSLAVLLVLALWDLPVIIAFSKETVHTIQTWKMGGKKVELVRRQGWAGPPYQRYELRDFRIFGLIVKTSAYGYPDSLDGCDIELTENNRLARPIYIFDHCNGKLTTIKAQSR